MGIIGSSRREPARALVLTVTPVGAAVTFAPAALASASGTIDMHVGLALPTWACFAEPDFTYFQALASIPAGATISTFSVDVNRADIGARASLFNPSYRVALDGWADISGPAWSCGLGSHTFSATATDSAVNAGTGSTSFMVTVDPASLCAIAREFSTEPDITHRLCVRLEAAAARGRQETGANGLGAFANEKSAQSGKALTAYQAGHLTQFAAALD